MSTPVSVDPPPMAHIRTDSEQERDLQAKIQRMITLQYEEQHHSSTEDDNPDGDIAGEGDYRETIGGVGSMGLPKRTTTEMMNLSSMGETIKLEPAHRGITPVPPSHKIPWPSERQVLEDLPPASPQQGVGRGTLLFSSTYDGRRRLNSGDQLQGMGSTQTGSHQHQPPPLPPQQQAFPPRQIYAGYGAVGTTASHPPPVDFSFQEEDRHPPLHEHDFRYGNPDINNPYEDEQDLKPQRYRPEDSICAKICCLYVPIANLLLQENVHRSFCYGSIDGMLTGSGIAAAFSALQVLSIHARWEVRLAVLAFTAAACIADAVCMAIGHVWTSFIVSSGHAQERNRERQMVEGNKAEAKARLVEMLLARGVLKIDAMSLADTLEGYPDMFVSALVGDSLLGAVDFAEDETDDGQQHQHHPLLPITGRESDGSMGFGDSWKFPSYGQFNEMDHEPDAGKVNIVLKESQIEGFFMMLGFATFALIPSLLWLAIPPIVLPAALPASIKGAVVASETVVDSVSGGQVISVPSLVASISGVIMWFLGVWKSKFMDSNWVMSGIENVVVLLACVLSAYGVGFALSYGIGGHEGLTLTNVVH